MTYKRSIPPKKTSITDPIYSKTSPDEGRHEVEVRHRYPIIGKDIPVVRITDVNINPHGVCKSLRRRIQVLW